MRLLAPSANNLPMPAPMLPVLYWSESTGGWWPGISRHHRACRSRREGDLGGWLRPIPPGAVVHSIGWVTCDRCSVDVAEIQDRRRQTYTPREWAALPVPQPTRGRPPSQPPSMRPCPVCGTREIRATNERCRDCWRQVQRDRSLAARIVALLRDGPRFRADLCEHFGVGPNFLRQGINNARNSGHAIALERGRGIYRLEGP